MKEGNMRSVNQDIKDNIKQNNLFQYQVADQMGISETTLVRWLRYPLDEDIKEQIFEAINELKEA